MTVQSWYGAPQQFGLPQMMGIAGASANDIQLNAANMGAHYTGYIEVEGGGTKTLSAAGGGSIRVMTGTATNVLANGGTEIRVGLQDPSTSASPGQGDGTFDVYGSMVGGVYSLADAAPNTVTMSSGSKNVTNGDKVSLVMKMVTRGGADVVRFRPHTSSGASTAVPKQFPVVASESSGGVFAAVAAVPLAVIIFDDGTRGWIHGGVTIGNTTNFQSSTSSFNSSSNPDEYACVFRLTAPVQVRGLWAFVLHANNSSDWELILYGDALGTPTALATITVDATQVAQATSSRQFDALLATPVNLAAGTWYAVAIRPTGANTVTAAYHDYAAADDMKGMPGGAEMAYGTRTNQTGAFSVTSTRRLWAGIAIGGSDDGAGGGGGGGLRLIGAGGLAG